VARSKIKNIEIPDHLRNIVGSNYIKEFTELELIAERHMDRFLLF